MINIVVWTQEKVNRYNQDEYSIAFALPGILQLMHKTDDTKTKYFSPNEWRSVWYENRE